MTALVLLGLDASQTDRYRIAIYVFSAVAVVVYAGTGHVIASRVPRNAIGWVLCLVGLSLAATMMTEQYALRGLVAAPGSLPAARLAGWLSEVMFVLTFAPMFFLVVLFPDGLTAVPAVAAGVLGVVRSRLASAGGRSSCRLYTAIVGGFTNILVAPKATYPNPLGVFPRHGWFSGFLLVTLFLGLVTLVLVVASVFARRRAASAEPEKAASVAGLRRLADRRLRRGLFLIRRDHARPRQFLAGAPIPGHSCLSARRSAFRWRVRWRC